MNELEIKKMFYINKIKNSKHKIIKLREQIQKNKIDILNFIKSIEDNKLKEYVLHLYNEPGSNEPYIINIDNANNNEPYIINIDNVSNYLLKLLKSEYKQLKYEKNVLNENWLLQWTSLITYEERLDYIIRTYL
jgi:hypothetical protein